MPAHPYFLSCDWGTTSLRLCRIETATGRVMSQLETALCGVRDVAASISTAATAAQRAAHFAQVLVRQISALPGSTTALDPAPPVVVSGMASSSIGWKELPYAGLPFPVDGSTARCEWLEVTVSDRTLPVLLVSGVATPTDMMRGEETQLIGLLTQAPYSRWASDGLVVLPGTHSKHVRVRNGCVIGFTTFMTGELFDVLCRHSVLRFTVAPTASPIEEETFRQGVQAAKSPGLMQSLFQVRTRGVLRRLSTAANRSFLSGLLVGAELRELAEATPQVLLAAPDDLARLYQLAAGDLNLRSQLRVVDTRETHQAVFKGHARLLERSHP